MVVQVANPYGNRRTKEGEAPGINTGSAVYYARYAVPDIPDTTDPEWTTGYATELDSDYESGTTPSAIRLGLVEPPENDPNDREYNARRNQDFFRRHSVEETVTHWNVKQRRVPPGQNPLWEQPRPPTRPTADDSPTSYLFTRPWHIPRFLHSIDPSLTRHISMADHRRKYEIFGMRSRDRMGVNTYRLDPEPWDESLYPPQQVAEPEVSASAAQPGNRSYRLG